MPQFDIDAIRAEIHALDKSIYMNTGGSGPLPNSVAEDIISAYQDVAENGADIPTVRGPVRDRFESARQVSADLFGVDSSDIALFRAISEGSAPWHTGSTGTLATK